MAAIAVRMFGGPEVDCFPHNSFFYQKYSFLLQSPWASSLDQESVYKIRECWQIYRDLVISGAECGGHLEADWPHHRQ